jgi:hypothetical protein
VSAAVHVIDDVIERRRTGEPERSLAMDSAKRASTVAYGHDLALPVAAIPERAAAIAQDLIEMKVEVAIDWGALNQMACGRAGDLGMVCETNVMQTREIELDKGLRINLPHLEVRHACQQNRPGTRLGARSSHRYSKRHYSK